MAWQRRVGSDAGLFSLVTILMVIAIRLGFWHFLGSRIAEDQRHDRTGD